MNQRRRKNIVFPFLNKMEWILYNENAIFEAVDNYKKTSVINEIKNPENISDPTAFQAMKNLTPVDSVTIGDKVLKRPENWLSVIKETYSYCNKLDAQFAQAMKWRYSGYSTNRICCVLGVGVEKFFRWLHTFRMLFSMKAASENLIRPF